MKIKTTVIILISILVMFVPMISGTGSMFKESCCQERLKTFGFTQPPLTCSSLMIKGWSEMAKLIASDGTANNWFGCSVSISGDYAIIGANGYNSTVGANTGSAYIFRRSETGWVQEAKLLASDGAAGDLFGCSVSLSGDTALIGAYGNDNTNGVDAGAAYVFKRSETGWLQEAKLLASDSAAGDLFGCSVSLSGDTALIGAYGNDNTNGVDAGAAYVFKRSGNNWTQVMKLTSTDGKTNHRFGNAVYIDEDYAVIGAFTADIKGAPNAGSAYVFKRYSSVWIQEAKLTASDGATNDWFGYSVVIFGDYSIIGAPWKDTNAGIDAGCAYVFQRSGSNWIERAKLVASDGAAGDLFGISVSLSVDYALIGAYRHDTDDGKDIGAAYVFKRSGTIWVQEAKLTPLGGRPDTLFGCSVSLSGFTALIGAKGDTNGKGSAYIFLKEDTNMPPCPPIIEGPSRGKAGIAYLWNFTSIDFDDDDIYYRIDWGDGTVTDWFGSYQSGQTMSQSHVYYHQGVYVIKARAKDIYGNEGNWATLEISMPTSYHIPRQGFWQKVFETYPNAFLLTRYLLRL